MRNAVVLLGLCWAVACAQELEVPGRASDGSAGVGLTSGITGLAGEANGDTAHGGRLFVADEPAFGANAGNGGADGQRDLDPRTSAGGRTGVGGRRGTGEEDAGGAAGATSPSGPPALIFSEYLEGSGSYKALEIYAFESATLEGCELETYFNGKLEPGRLALHGAIAAGETYLLCSPALDDSRPGLCDRSTNLTFNGDDALALRCSGELVDVFGQIGVDPGAAWGSGATSDHVLRRRCDVSAGRKRGDEPFDPALEWVQSDADAFEDLGQHACAAQ